MKVYDICSRIITNPQIPYQPLIDTFGQPDAKLWPYELWPRDEFIAPLAVGTVGGHGDTKYELETYVPGHKIVFRFISPAGYKGTHGYEILTLPNNKLEIRHTTDVDLSTYHWLMWQLIIYWVHRSLVNDSLDKAELYLTRTIIKPHRWPWYVYVIRHTLGALRIVKHLLIRSYKWVRTYVRRAMLC